jgi:hypothetical protein
MLQKFGILPLGLNKSARLPVLSSEGRKYRPSSHRTTAGHRQVQQWFFFLTTAVCLAAQWKATGCNDAKGGSLRPVLSARAQETRRRSFTRSRQRRETLPKCSSTSLGFFKLWNSAVCGNFGGGMHFEACVRTDARGGNAHRLRRWGVWRTCSLVSLWARGSSSPRSIWAVARNLIFLWWVPPFFLPQKTQKNRGDPRKLAENRDWPSDGWAPVLRFWQFFPLALDKSGLFAPQ